MIFLALPNFFSFKVEGHDQSSITKKTNVDTSGLPIPRYKDSLRSRSRILREKGNQIQQGLESGTVD